MKIVCQTTICFIRNNPSFIIRLFDTITGTLHDIASATEIDSLAASYFEAEIKISVTTKQLQQIRLVVRPFVKNSSSKLSSETRFENIII